MNEYLADRFGEDTVSRVFRTCETEGLRDNRTAKLQWGLVTSDTHEMTNLTATESNTAGMEGISDL